MSEGGSMRTSAHLVKLFRIPVRLDHLNLVHGPEQLDEKQEPMLHRDNAAQDGAIERPERE